MSQLLQGQSEQLRPVQTGSIIGTVTDVNGDTVAIAKVVLAGPNPSDRHTAITNKNGFFEFHDVRPGVSYRVIVSGAGFADWQSPIVTIAPNQSRILTGIRLRIATAHTTIQVTPGSQVQIATEQVKEAETQRIFGIIPNFYLVYDHDAEPLTTKLNFKLATNVLFDPVTIIDVATFAGINQAADNPNYGQGAKGYADRFGAGYADGAIDICDPVRTNEGASAVRSAFAVSPAMCVYTLTAGGSARAIWKDEG